MPDTQSVDTAIVGAGPYGLSLAAHLAARGADFAVFGPPLDTWRTRMPKGMQLKSDGFASNLSAPGDGATLADHCAAVGRPYHDTDIPVPLADFVDYGLAFQKRWVPGLDTRRVASVAPTATGFALALEDGERLSARKVVLAVGITHFAYTPEPFAALPPELASHASAHHDCAAFAGRDVTILGAGSSAVDLAVAMAEAGARTRLVARRRALPFGSPPSGRPRSLLARLRHPSSGLGPGWRSRLSCDAPDVFRALPARARLAIVRRHLGPASPHRLKAPLEAGVEVIAGHALEAAEPAGGRLRLRLSPIDGGPAREAATEHLICATGYRADVERLGFLDPALRRALRRVGGSPALSAGFESSRDGLYFTGLSAAATFGPLMRFMHGDDFAARRLAGRLTARRP